MNFTPCLVLNFAVIVAVVATTAAAIKPIKCATGVRLAETNATNANTKQCPGKCFAAKCDGDTVTMGCGGTSECNRTHADCQCDECDGDLCNLKLWQPAAGSHKKTVNQLGIAITLGVALLLLLIIATVVAFLCARGRRLEKSERTELQKEKKIDGALPHAMAPEKQRPAGMTASTEKVMRHAPKNDR